MIQVYMILLTKTFHIKKTRAFYHACDLSYLTVKFHTFQKNRLYFRRPLYFYTRSQMDCHTTTYNRHTEQIYIYLVFVIFVFLYLESLKKCFATTLSTNYQYFQKVLVKHQHYQHQQEWCYIEFNASRYSLCITYLIILVPIDVKGLQCHTMMCCTLASARKCTALYILIAKLHIFFLMLTISWAQVAAKLFMQNPRQQPFKIKKECPTPQHQSNTCLSIDTNLEPPQFSLDNSF